MSSNDSDMKFFMGQKDKNDFKQHGTEFSSKRKNVNTTSNPSNFNSTGE